MCAVLFPYSSGDGHTNDTNCNATVTGEVTPIWNNKLTVTVNFSRTQIQELCYFTTQQEANRGDLPTNSKRQLLSQFQ
jgi:hypothetical protein